MRRRLPRRRRTDRFQVKLDGHTVHITVGLYEDGTPGEVWVDLHKEGGPVRVLAKSTAMAISLALQHGCSIAELEETMGGLAGQPGGEVKDHDEVRWADSIPDLVVRILRTY